MSSLWSQEGTLHRVCRALVEQRGGGREGEVLYGIADVLLGHVPRRHINQVTSVVDGPRNLMVHDEVGVFGEGLQTVLHQSDLGGLIGEVYTVQDFPHQLPGKSEAQARSTDPAVLCVQFPFVPGRLLGRPSVTVSLVEPVACWGQRWGLQKVEESLELAPKRSEGDVRRRGYPH